MTAHFDLVDLRLMLHVAHTKSVTRGAEAACISTPAASTRIKNLEEGFGTKLLYRTNQGVTLTVPGQLLVYHARLAIGHLEDLRGEIQDFSTGMKGCLRVLASTTAMAEFLPPVLRSYLRGHPNVNIDLREKPSSEIVRAVSDGQTDLGIVAGTERTENLEVVPYRQDRLALVVPAEHAFAQCTSIEFAQVLPLNFIGLHDASAIQEFLRRICADMGQPLKVRIQVGSFEAACRMIEATVGVGVLPASAAQRHAKTMKIVLVPLRDAWSHRSMQICMRSFDSLPQFARDLVAMLVEDRREADPPDAQSPFEKTTPGAS
ncbi:LysR substrate-binding domain-containing protein [Variovorax boronicumulans]